VPTTSKTKIKGTKMKTTTTIIHHSLAAFAFACFALVPTTRAVNPTPDGCYPNYTTAEGCNALQLLTTGAGNTALGWGSLQLDTTGSFNTGLGAGALLLNNGDSNTAVGAVALLLNTSGAENTAVGTDALVYNDTGDDNTAVGFSSLFNNTSGFNNTAVGFRALFNNVDGAYNTAIGTGALENNGVDLNTAVGFHALQHNTEGSGNTATGGFDALYNNITGTDNAAFGSEALFSNTEHGGNTALGKHAGYSSTGSFNTFVGYSAGTSVTTANNIICIGASLAGADVDNSCFIGNIRGVTTQNADAIAVVIDSAGQLGTMSSSARFKKAIKPMDKASEAILALKPVTFEYKSDTKGTPQFGLIAEDVARVNPDLVVRDRTGEIYTVRYEAVNAMLLNEFLKAHHQLQDLKGIVAEQQKQIKALTSGLQKVSAQMQLSKPAPQTVLNNQ
jgi:Chaperone of endosialidase